MQLINRFIILILLASSFTLFGQTSSRVVQIESQVDDHILRVLDRQTRLSRDILRNPEFLRRLQVWNPQLIDFPTVRPGDVINLNLGGQGHAELPSESPQKERSRRVDYGPSKWSSSLRYSFQRGDYSELSPTAQELLTKSQNSFLRLGFDLNYRLSRIDFLRLSGDWIPFNDEDGEDSRPDYQIGLYYLRNLNLISESLRGVVGLNLKTLHSIDFTTTSDLEIQKIRNVVPILTFGLEDERNFLNLDLHIQGSVGLALESLGANDSKVERDNLSGISTSFTIGIQNYRPFIINLLYEYYSLSSATEITINRYGLGLQYNF